MVEDVLRSKDAVTTGPYDDMKPWWEVWDTDWNVSDTASSSSQAPAPMPSTTYRARNRRKDGRTRTHKKHWYPDDHALTASRKYWAAEWRKFRAAQHAIHK